MRRAATFTAARLFGVNIWVGAATHLVALDGTGSSPAIEAPEDVAQGSDAAPDPCGASCAEGRSSIRSPGKTDAVRARQNRTAEALEDFQVKRSWIDHLPSHKTLSRCSQLQGLWPACACQTPDHGKQRRRRPWHVQDTSP